MKKAISLFVMVIMLCGLLQTPALAAGIEPRYTNTALAQTDLSFSNDVANVVLSYDCYESSGISVKITTTLQKKFMLFWWTDLTTWTDYSTNSSNVIVHNYETSSGTHRVLVTYEVTNVNTGITDVIEHEVEKKN